VKKFEEESRLINRYLLENTFLFDCTEFTEFNIGCL